MNRQNKRTSDYQYPYEGCTIFFTLTDTQGTNPTSLPLG